MDDYESRSIPLDVFVIDMDWHTKDNWSGFTFDPHLFPFPEDSMGYLNAKGLFVTLNLHDASGVNNWDAMFQELVEFTGKGGAVNKITDKTVPMNLVNASVTYAVEDIVLGDLIKNKHVSFWWIDWQQGGAQGGMTGYKQNPTIWLVMALEPHVLPPISCFAASTSSVSDCSCTRTNTLSAAASDVAQ